MLLLSLGGKNESEESNQKDFKNLTFNFSMEHGERVKRKIEMFNEWRTLLNEYDLLNGIGRVDSTSHDNIQENFNYLWSFYLK